MRLKQLSIALLLAFSAHSAFAMDLLDAWHAAQSKDPAFSAARAGAEAGKKKNDQAKALGLPQVTATAATGLVSSFNKIKDAEFSAPGMGSAGGASFKTQTDQGVDLRWQISAEQSLYNAERATSARQLNKQAEFAEVKFSAEEQQVNFEG